MDTRPTRDDRDELNLADEGDAHDLALCALARGFHEDHAPPAAAPQPLSLIRDMARDFGVSVRALRFYEDRGLLRPQRRGSTRLYGERERRDLAAILKGKRLGFTLAEIAALRASQGEAPEGGNDELEFALPPEQIAAQIGFLERQRQELDAAIVALRKAHRHLMEVSCGGAMA